MPVLPEGKVALYLYITPKSREKLSKIVNYFQKKEYSNVSLGSVIEKMVDEQWTILELLTERENRETKIK